MAGSPSGAYSLAALAQRYGLELRGDAETLIQGVCTLSPGREGAVGFLANPRYKSQLADSRASAVILRAEDAEGHAGNVLIAADPYLAFARIAALFERRPRSVPGVHPTAVVDATASVDPSAAIGPQVYIAAGAEIGAEAVIGPGCVIEEDAVIGAGSRLEARVYVGIRCRLGRRCSIGPGAVIGSRGFGLARGPDGWEDVPQTGTVRLGDHVEVGANTTIDRGAIDDTVIEDGVKLDNQIQVGHNVHIGARTAIAACVGISGSTRIGSDCLIGGGSGIGGHIEIGNGVVLQAWSMVTRSLQGPGQYAAGWPAEPVREWRRSVARLRRLGRLEERITALESAISAGRLSPDDGVETSASGG